MFSCILTDKLPKQESIRLNSPINWLGFEESQILHGKESYRTLKSIHLFQFQMNNKKEYIELNQELTFVSMNLGLVFNPIERKRQNAKFFFLSEIRQGNISLPKKKKKRTNYYISRRQPMTSVQEIKHLPSFSKTWVFQREFFQGVHQR